MRGMSVEEKNRYCQEWHNKLMERAQKKGIPIPDAPGSNHGSGMGQGMGPSGGMGGGGMGRGGRR